MPNLLNKIKELIPELQTKDIAHANNFIIKRDWESLKDLTWSALQRIELSMKKGEIPERYANLDIDKIRELALLCNEYYYLIYPEEDEIEDDFEDEEEI